MQRATPEWVAEAAARAEQRLGGNVGTHHTPVKALEQVQTLIDAIMDPRVKRDELRRIAKSMSGEAAR